jgi:hypothetical protein
LELLLQHGNSFLNLFFLQPFFELLRINPDRERTASNNTALEFNSIGSSWESPKEPTLVTPGSWPSCTDASTYSNLEQALRKCLV